MEDHVLQRQDKTLVKGRRGKIKKKKKVCFFVFFIDFLHFFRQAFRLF